MIVWCMINVMLDCDINKCNMMSTAAKGVVLEKNLTGFLVDFSEYCAKQGYTNCDHQPKWVSKYECVEAD